MSLEWKKLTGQDVAAAVGDGWLSCVPEADQAVVRGIFARAARTASDFSVRFRLCFADGSVRWIGAGGVPSYGPPDRTFIGYLGSMIEIAADTTNVMHAYGDVGRYIPPPTHPTTIVGDYLDQIADHLIIAYSLIEEDGGKPALPALREALFEIGLSLGRKVDSTKMYN